MRRALLARHRAAAAAPRRRSCGRAREALSRRQAASRPPPTSPSTPRGGHGLRRGRSAHRHPLPGRNDAVWSDSTTIRGEWTTSSARHRSILLRGARRHRLRPSCGDASAEDLATMHGFYCAFANTATRRRSRKASAHCRTSPTTGYFFAMHEAKDFAGALCLRGGTAVRALWGACHPFPACTQTFYYPGIDYCLREGLACSAGAQRAQDRARLPVPSCAQPARDRGPRFREAILPGVRGATVVRTHSPGSRSDRPSGIRPPVRECGSARPRAGRPDRPPDPDAPIAWQDQGVRPRLNPLLQWRGEPAPATTGRRSGCALPRRVQRAAPARWPARLWRRPVRAEAAQRLPARHLPVVFGRAADPVVVAGPTHGVRQRRLRVLPLPAQPAPRWVHGR